jgi:trimeric autotransporter adhesin
MKHTFILLITALISVPLAGNAQRIRCVAGSGQCGYSGDDGSAIYAKLNKPTGMAEDKAGNIYIADKDNNVIRRVDVNGVITTFAGNGKPGYTGDNGPAADAKLRWPNDVKIDNDGNVLIVDEGNNVIRRVDRSGIITTIIGRGGGDFNGDGGQASNASLLIPTSLAIDTKGNIYVADAGNERIRKIDRKGIIRTIAGDGMKGYYGDGMSATMASIAYVNGIAADRDGNLYFAQKDNNVIRKIDTRGIITTIAGNGKKGFSGDGGPAVNAMLNDPYGLAVSKEGDLYVADNSNERIRKIDRNGTITTIAGTGSAGYKGDGGTPTFASFNYPSFVSMTSDGGLLVADQYNHRIRKIKICQPLDPKFPKNINVAKGHKLQLPDLIPGSKWTTRSDIATISASGVLTGASEGSVILTYTTPDDPDCDMKVFLLNAEVGPANKKK